MDRLAGKVALVTGSTKGIGRAIAIRFAAEGAAVVVSGRSRPEGEAVASEITSNGGRASFVQCDLGDERSVRALIESCTTRYGRLTTLVNNAFPTERVRDLDRPVGEFTTEAWREAIEIGLTGCLFLPTHHALPLLRASGNATILNITSRASTIGVRSMSAYSAVKGAMNSLTRSLALDYADDGLRANAIVVGFVVAGEMSQQMAADPALAASLRSQRLTRLGVPDDIAHAAVWLCSDESAFVTSQIISVDGGAGTFSPSPPMAAGSP